MKHQGKTAIAINTASRRARRRSVPRIPWPLAWLLALAVPASAQSCALCYTSAAAGGSDFIHALRGAILVLLIPPVLMFAALVVLIFRWPSVMPVDH